MAVYKDGKTENRRRTYAPVSVPVQASAPATATVPVKPDLPEPVVLDDETMRQLAAVIAREMAAGNLMGGLDIGKVTDTVRSPPKGCKDA